MDVTPLVANVLLQILIPYNPKRMEVLCNSEMAAILLPFEEDS
jgi:hypothetical protein